MRTSFSGGSISARSNSPRRFPSRSRISSFPRAGRQADQAIVQTAHGMECRSRGDARSGSSPRARANRSDDRGELAFACRSRSGCSRGPRPQSASRALSRVRRAPSFGTVPRWPRSMVSPSPSASGRHLDHARLPGDLVDVPQRNLHPPLVELGPAPPVRAHLKDDRVEGGVLPVALGVPRRVSIVSAM